MTQPVIITVAITGAVPRKKDNPAVPVTPAEQIESTHEAFEAGASLVHIHVRNPDESPGSDPELYGRVQEGVRKHCPGMIVQFSTGGRGREQAKRGAMLYLKPDMASLATGSVNFPDRHLREPAGLRRGPRANHAGQRHQARDRSVRPGDALQRGEPGEKGPAQGAAARAVRDGHTERDAGAPLDLRLSALRAHGGAARRNLGGRRHRPASVGSQPMVSGSGGHCRTGLEDNLRIEPDRLAASNAELVSKIAEHASATTAGRQPRPKRARFSDLLSVH